MNGTIRTGSLKRSSVSAFNELDGQRLGAELSAPPGLRVARAYVGFRTGFQVLTIGGTAGRLSEVESPTHRHVLNGQTAEEIEYAAGH
jgi:hypothetical protein